MLGSACIQTGTLRLIRTMTVVVRIPMNMAMMKACMEARLARSNFFAPKDWEIKARKPTPTALMDPISSQLAVMVEPTAAVARVPMEPTMAVSM